MSRFARIRRRPDHWASSHERARRRSAERLDGPLGLAEAEWLEEHLAACPACAEIAAAYERDRAALRMMRDTAPEPPRDLWARTAAAIEREAGSRPSDAADRSAGGPRGWPLGALSALAVVIVVIGATALSGRGPFGGPTQLGDPGVALASATPAASLPGPTPAPLPTPIVVGAGDVAWIDRGPGGSLGYAAVEVDEVCPDAVGAGCAVVGDGPRASVELLTTPRSVIGSPDGRRAIAISEDAEGVDQLTIVRLPEPSASPAPSARPSPDPTATSEATPAPASPGDPSPTPGSETSPEPILSPAPTTAAAVAIASGIEVIGESAAFSIDGMRFAFTARPADRSGGADVYVWSVGDAEARRVTDDGASYFASWIDDGLIVSRPSTPDEPSADARSVIIDPETGQETEVGDLWRPVVDPTGAYAIVWDGTIEHPAGGTTPWLPGDGTLALRPWSDEGPLPGPGGRDRRITDDASGGYDVRWDETGEWLAVWVADPLDASIGRLTLYRLDREAGRLERVDDAPVQVPALPGFSIGDGRLAWATPRGQGGEGSRVQIAAWHEGDVGIVESAPGEGIVVIR